MVYLHKKGTVASSGEGVVVASDGGSVRGVDLYPVDMLSSAFGTLS